MDSPWSLVTAPQQQYRLHPLSPHPSASIHSYFTNFWIVSPFLVWLPALNYFSHKYLSGFCFPVSVGPAWPRSMGTLETPWLYEKCKGDLCQLTLCCCARAGWQILPPRKPQMSNCLQYLYLENHPNSREQCPGIATSHPTARCAVGKDQILEAPQMSFNSLSPPRCFYFPGGSAVKWVLPGSHLDGD